MKTCEQFSLIIIIIWNGLPMFLSLPLLAAGYWSCSSEQRQPDGGDPAQDQDERISELGTTAFPDHLHCSANTQVFTTC